jgi:hypothetical protein
MTEYTKTYPKEVEDLLKGLVDNFQRDDQAVRERQIRTWRRLKMLWENFQSTYYSEVAHDWRIPNEVRAEAGNDQAYYDKPINVFRAYLESIIAALSVTIPGIKCYPDDADNILDINTAKAGDKISKLIYRHNDVSLLWLHALFIYCTEGLVFSYTRPVCKKEYGQYTKKEYEPKTSNYLNSTCPQCGYPMDIAEIEGAPPEELELPTEPEECEGCGAIVIPEVSHQSVEVDELVSEEVMNKSRVCIEAYGGLNVKVPNWARTQEECLYLNYSYETHYGNALEEYPHLFNQIDVGVFDPYEVWGRLSPQYRNEYPRDNVTMRHIWLRPAAFNTLHERDRDKLKSLFEDGVRIDLVNDTYAGCEAENLDERWTLTHNPMADYVHHDPIGLLLVSVQEMTNDLLSLTLQTIEHGIPQTFADPSVLDFQGYRQMETTPGSIFPAKAKSGKSIGDGFHEIKTAQLSQEVMPFGQEIQNMGQLVSGALPSLFGGAMSEQKTASGYAMSRAQALQRLQNTWKMFTIWWKTTYSKAIPQYIETIEEDERDVQLDKTGGFINVFIRRAELEGKIGKYELEANENLPLTWSQRKDVVMQLMQLNNPVILETLGSPENLPLLREAIGLDEFHMPGQDDVDAEYEEIRLLLNSTPLPGGIDAMGQPTELPSVDIDPDIDNHQIRFQIDRTWLISEVGRDAKTSNPLGYQNVLLHAKQHLMMIQMAMQARMQAEQQANNSEGAPNKKPKETDKNAPIESEADVKTI